MLRSLSSRAALLTGTFVTAGVGYAAMAPRARVASANAPKRAVCVLTPDQNSGVNGVVNFSQPSPTSPTTITARITGLTDGAHGFHVHAWGNLTQGCTTAGPHYNPFNKTHGGPKDQERHVGDLGNIHSSGGVATYSATDSLITLHGEHSIIGRSMVVHADEDDLGRGGYADSKTTGHAGGRKYVLHTPLLTSFRVQTPRYALPFTSHTHHMITRSFSTHVGKSAAVPRSNNTSPSPTAASVAAPSQHIPTTPIVNGPRATITDDVNRPPPSHFTKTQTERAAVVSAQPKHTSPRKKKLRGKLRNSEDDISDDEDFDDTPPRIDDDISDDDRPTREQQPSKQERWKARLKSTPQAKEARLQRARERELDRERARMKKASKQRDMI